MQGVMSEWLKAEHVWNILFCKCSPSTYYVHPVLRTWNTAGSEHTVLRPCHV